MSKPRGVLSPDQAAIVALFMRDEKQTVRSVAEHIGRSVSQTYALLLVLREKGLVTWEKGRRGTLRANFVMAWPEYMLDR